MPDGTDIWYSKTGQGPALVLCNGYVCTTQYWPLFVQEFSRDFTVIQWDYRSHGRSSVPRNLKTQNIAQYARDLTVVMDAAGIADAVILGHSMGVQVILTFAGLFPQRTRGLVALCGSYKNPLASISESKVFERILLSLAAGAYKIEPVFWPTLKRLLLTDLAIFIAYQVGANPQLCPRMYLEQLFAHTTSMDGKAAIQSFVGMITHSAADILPGIRCPSLIICGGIDKATTPALSREMHNQISGSELEIYAECSHLAMIERPDAVHSRIRRFLKEHELI